MRCIEFDSKYNFEKRKLLSLHSPAGVNYRLKVVLRVIVRTGDNFNSSKSCFHMRILRLKNYDFILGPVYENDSISIWVLSLFHCSFLPYYSDTWNIGYDSVKCRLKKGLSVQDLSIDFFFFYLQINFNQTPRRNLPRGGTRPAIRSFIWTQALRDTSKNNKQEYIVYFPPVKSRLKNKIENDNDS